MTELVTAHPESFALALAFALAVDLFRRLFETARTRLTRYFSTALAPRPVQTLAADLAGYALVAVLAVVAFIPALVVLVDVAALTGVGRLQLARLPNGMLLLALLVGAFLGLQVWHLMNRDGFVRRARYLLLLVALPLFAQILAWLALAHFKPQVPAAALTLHLLSLGVLPYLMPLIHGRALAPLMSAAADVPRLNRRRAVRRLGNVLAVAATAAVLVWYGAAAHRQALGSAAGMAYHPAPEISKGSRS